MQRDDLQTGTFVNGKAQAAEILQALTSVERKRILNHISIKNPQLAFELSQKSFGFTSLQGLSKHDILRVCNGVNPKIFGIALKGSSAEVQRDILSLMDRAYAELVYEGLVHSIANETQSIERAQNKVIENVSRLVRSKQISLG